MFIHPEDALNLHRERTAEIARQLETRRWIQEAGGQVERRHAAAAIMTWMRSVVGALRTRRAHMTITPRHP